RVAEFIERTDKERKDIFSNILNLDECEKYSKAASTWRKELDGSWKANKGAITLLESQIAIAWPKIVSDAIIQQWADKCYQLSNRRKAIQERQAELAEESQKLHIIAELKAREQLLTQEIIEFTIKLHSATYSESSHAELEEQSNLANQAMLDLQQ